MKTTVTAKERKVLEAILNNEFNVEPPEPEIDDSLTECSECSRIMPMDANCDCVEWEATR